MTEVETVLVLVALWGMIEGEHKPPQQDCRNQQKEHFTYLRAANSLRNDEPGVNLLYYTTRRLRSLEHGITVMLSKRGQAYSLTSAVKPKAEQDESVVALAGSGEYSPGMWQPAPTLSMLGTMDSISVDTLYSQIGITNA